MSQRPNFFLYVGSHRGDRLGRGHVALAGQRLTPGRFDHLRGVFARRDIGDRDMHAVLGQTFGKSLADAFRSAGDNGDLVLVAFGHAMPPNVYGAA